MIVLSCECNWAQIGLYNKMYMMHIHQPNNPMLTLQVYNVRSASLQCKHFTLLTLQVYIVSFASLQC